MDELMLSIYIATYNHEAYIAEALDSVLMQETDYKYEVLVGEDCSTDGTKAILKEYERMYPGRFQMFYRDHNMYNDEVRNGEDLKRRCKGKYIIALEGDDFWTDKNKIQKQISFLESHPDYVAVAHNCVVVGKDSKPIGESYPECKEPEYTIWHLANNILPGQLTTVMYRNFYAHEILDASLCKSKYTPGDRCIYFSLVANGKVYCMQEVMSAYRHITDSGSSFSATYVYKFRESHELYKGMLIYAKQVGNKEAEKYASFMYLRNLYMGMKFKQCTWTEFFTSFKFMTYKISAVWIYVQYIFNKRRHKNKG